MKSKLLWAILWSIILPLTLAGCATLEMSTVIWPDGSGTRRVAVAMDEKLYNLAQLRGQDPFAELKARGEEMGARVEPFHRQGQVGIAMEVDFPDLDTLNLGLGTESFETVRAEKSGRLFKQAFTFHAQIDTTKLPQPPRPLPPGIKIGDVQRFDFIYSVTLPGEIISHNADEVQDNRLTWHIDPLDKTKTIYDLEATSQVENQALRTGALVFGAGLMGLIILIGLIRLLRR